MYAWQFAKALWTSDKLGIERFESMQNHYNLAYREEEREMIPLCNDQEIAIIPWSPLARGFLTGKYTRNKKPKGHRISGDHYLTERYFKSDDFDVAERLIEVAKNKGVTPPQVAMAWLLEKNVTSPIIGATKVSHVEEAVGAMDVHLNRNDMKRLEEPYKLHPTIGFQ